jgi:L-aspartate oxidase
MPKGLRTQIRSIMQKAYFVLPNISELGPGLEKVTEIKDMLYNGNYNIDKDYVEAKSLATVAYIVLSEAWKIATENAEITKSKHP